MYCTTIFTFKKFVVWLGSSIAGLLEARCRIVDTINLLTLSVNCCVQYPISAKMYCMNLLISPVPGIITRVDVVSISTTSAVVSITYNESITIGSDSYFNVAVNINPGGITAFQALSPPEQSIRLNSLQPNTEYRGTVQIVSSTAVTVDSISVIFTTISGE